MKEVLHDFGIVQGTDGTSYHVRACGAPMDETLWEAWIEFEPITGPGAGGPILRSPRETTQPNRTDAEYWATGLTLVYLEGALDRALNPSTASNGSAPQTLSVLNPFSVYRKGEALLRDQLGALAPWHLVNIIVAHRLSSIPAEELQRMPAPHLIELIIAGVRLAETAPAPEDANLSHATEP